MVKERLQGHRNRPAFRAGLFKKRADKDHHSAKIAKSHHAKAVARQSVVSVVPFRPLGVQPNAAVGNKVCQLCQNQLKQLCRHSDHIRASVLSAKLGVASEFFCVGQNLVVKVAHKRYCVARIFFDVGVSLDVVGNIGRRENFLVQKFRQNARVKFVLQLQKLLQVNDLVVVPVADVGPRIVRLRNFPIKARARYAVGVKAVGGRRVKKLGNHSSNVNRIAHRERFPVLENVAPVSFVVQNRLAKAVLQVNRKLVPRTAGVAVPARERKRKVFQIQALQLRVARRADRLAQLRVIHRRRQAQSPRVAGLGAVSRFNKVDEVRRLNVVVLDEHAAAHNVEHYVGLVVNRSHFVGGVLQAVRAGDVFFQQGARRVNVGQDFLFERGAVLQSLD